MHISSAPSYFLLGFLIIFDGVLCDIVPPGSLWGKNGDSLEHGNLKWNTSTLSEKEIHKFDDGYQLSLTSSSPAVLDSVLKFHAELIVEDKEVSNKTLFLYKWKNSANGHELFSDDNYQSSINERSFTSSDVSPGIYHMKVAVYKKEKFLPFKYTHKVAEGVMEFNLTKYLNGRLQVNQHIKYKKDKHIFATRQPLNLSSILTDTFESNFSYAFIWFLNDTFQEWNQTMGSILYNATQPGDLDITVKVKASSQDWPDSVNKEGTFTKIITLKDQINITNVTSAGEIHEGQPVTINVSYNGSNPTEICWNLTKMSLNLTEVNTSCTWLYGHNNNYSIQLPDEVEIGSYNLTITVKNDVSRVKTQTSFTVVDNHNEDHKKSPMIAITVTFCIVGVIVTSAALGYAALRTKKRSHETETADFNFHPHIRTSESNLSVMLKNLINQFLEREQYKRSSSLVETASSRSYGSLESSTNADNEIL